MPQTFHVLRCCRCEVFQVQQVKKVKKWACKMCGEKQSVLRVYGHGAGLECRKHVQKLNMMRGEKETLLGQHLPGECEEFTVDVPSHNNSQGQMDNTEPPSHGTRWAQYVEDEEEEEEKCKGDDDPQAAYTTDRNTFDNVRKENRKIQRKSFQRRFDSSSTPYERPSQPSHQQQHPAVQSFSSPQTSQSATSYQRKNQFRVPNKSSENFAQVEGNSESKTKWNKFTVQNDETEEGDDYSANRSNNTTGFPVSSSISKTGTKSKWSGLSNQENDKYSKSSSSSHSISRFKSRTGHNVPNTEVKSKWNSFTSENVENDKDFESDASIQSLNSPRFTDSVNAIDSKPSWNNVTTSELIDRRDQSMSSGQTLQKHKNLDLRHNVPSFSGSSHNAPIGKFSAPFGTKTIKSNLTKRKETDQKVNTGSKWGRFVVDAKESSEEEEEEEETVDQNEQGQIMVEIEGLNTDTIRNQTLKTNVFYTEQNFDLELEDW